MPHLSPMKWFNIYLFMMFWMFIFMVKLNFMFLTYPIKKIFKFNIMNLKWKF